MTDGRIAAGVAPPTGPGSSGNRGMLVVLAVGAAVVAVVVAIVALGSDGDQTAEDRPDESSTLPSSTSTSTTTTVALGEVISMVDSGWNVVKAEDGSNLTGSMGVVIQNTSDRPVGPLQLEVQVIGENDSVTNVVPYFVTLLRPGQRLGLGKGLLEVEHGVSRLEVTFPAQALRTPAGEPPEGSLTASPGETATEDERATVTYSVTSTFAFDINASSYLIFRDSAGKIVGGAEGARIATSPSQPGQGRFGMHADMISPEATSADVYLDPHSSGEFAGHYDSP